MRQKEIRNKHTNICFSSEDLDRLDLIAHENNRTRSDMIRMLILQEHANCITGNNPSVEPKYPSTLETSPKPKRSRNASKSIRKP